jgi:hypothetical protein
MPVPDAVKRMAECAGGKPVKVFTADGNFELRKSEDLPEQPSVAETVAAILLRYQADHQASSERLAQAIGKLEAKLEATLDHIKSEKEIETKSQREMVSVLSTLAETISLPVKPFYDDKGKLMGARRVKAL